MKILIHTTPERSRLGTIGHAVSVPTTEAGHQIREEFDDVVPKITTAASKAVHTVTHTAADRSRPAVAEAASRGSAALAGLLGEVTPAHIKKMSGRSTRRGARRRTAPRSRARTVLLLAAAGGAGIWTLWRRRSDPNLNPRLEEVSETGPEPVEGMADRQPA